MIRLRPRPMSTQNRQEIVIEKPLKVCQNPTRTEQKYINNVVQRRQN